MSRAFLTLCLVLVFSASVAAQTPDRPRVYAAADGLYQALYDPFTRRSTFRLFQENGSFTTIYPVAKPPAIAGTVVVRLWRVIGVAASLSRATSSSDASVEGSIPHPFYFDRPRRLEGLAPALHRSESGLHLQFRLVIPVRARLDLSLFAGPSRWQVRQDRVGEISFTSAYPYDTAQFTGVMVEERASTAWGYNAGVDVATYLTPHLGVGALLQVATANPEDDGSAATADTRIGGLRAGVGVRVRF